MEKTIGESRVRADFNVDNNSDVSIIKLDTAKLINHCEKIKNTMQDGEASRLAAIAQTHYETAAMYAVKAATTEKK